MQIDGSLAYAREQHRKSRHLTRISTPFGWVIDCKTEAEFEYVETLSLADTETCLRWYFLSIFHCNLWNYLELSMHLE